VKNCAVTTFTFETDTARYREIPVGFSKRKAALVAAAAMTASVAALPLSASAHEASSSFGALEAIGAQPLSAAEMDAVHGQAYTLAVLALLAYAAKVQTTQPQVAAQSTQIATSLSNVTVTTTRYYSRTGSGLVLIRR
jgi:hypothetical protein